MSGVCVEGVLHYEKLNARQASPSIRSIRRIRSAVVEKDARPSGWMGKYCTCAGTLCREKLTRKDEPSRESSR